MLCVVQRLSECSVAEVIEAEIKGDRFYDASKALFHAAGREDVDVRMLGSGRPFVLELINAKRINFDSDDVLRMEQAANESAKDRVEISKLRKADKVRRYTPCCLLNVSLPHNAVIILNSCHNFEIVLILRVFSR